MIMDYIMDNRLYFKYRIRTYMRNIHLSQIKNYYNNILFEYNKLTKIQPIDKIKELCNIFNSESTSDNKIVSPTYILKYLEGVKTCISYANKKRLDTSEIITEYILKYDNFKIHMKDEISETVDEYLNWTYENKQTYLSCYPPIDSTEKTTIIIKHSENQQSEIDTMCHETINTIHNEVIDTACIEVIDTTQSIIMDIPQIDVSDIPRSEVIDTTRCEFTDIPQSEVIDTAQSIIMDIPQIDVSDIPQSEVIDTIQSDIIYTASSKNDNKKRTISKNKITKRNIKKDTVQKKKVVVKRKNS